MKQEERFRWNFIDSLGERIGGLCQVQTTVQRGEVFYAGDGPLPYSYFPQARMTFLHFKHYNILGTPTHLFARQGFSSCKKKKKRHLWKIHTAVPKPGYYLGNRIIFFNFPGDTVVQPQLRTTGLEWGETKAESGDRGLSAPLNSQNKQTSQPAVLTASRTGSPFLAGKVQLFSEIRKEEACLLAKLTILLAWRRGVFSSFDVDRTTVQQPRSRALEGTGHFLTCSASRGNDHNEVLLKHTSWGLESTSLSSTLFPSPCPHPHHSAYLIGWG